MNIKEGTKISRLTVIRPWGIKDKHNVWLFVCECGNNIITRLDRVVRMEKRGVVLSCGHCSFKNYDRGDTVESSPYYYLYGVWRAIKNRCNNEHYKKYKDYGGRGIKVCDEWLNSYSTFKKWALDNGYVSGLSKKEQSIDRINVNGNYEPDNCRWVDMKTQAKNKRNNVCTNFHGENVSISELADRYSLSRKLVRDRYYKGKHGDELIKPKRVEQKYIINGELLTTKEISAKYNISRKLVWGRLEKGWHGKDVIKPIED